MQKRIKLDQNSAKNANKDVITFMDQIININQLEGTKFTERDVVENTSLMLSAVS